MRALLCIPAMLLAVAPALTAETPAAGAGAGTLVLSEDCLWRSYQVLRHPTVLREGGKTERMAIKWYWASVSAKAVTEPLSSPLPPDDWTGPDFDDGLWTRLKLPIYAGTPRGNNDCSGLTYDSAVVTLRNRFKIADPARAGDLKLSLSYYGGVIIYVNGKPVAHGHVPDNQPAAERLAEPYPEKAIIGPDGALLLCTPKNGSELSTLRLRRLSDVRIPKDVLRAGSNVLAIENVAAPTSGLLFKGSKTSPRAGWPPIGVQEIRLTTSAAEGVTPNTGRPKGFSLWTCPIHETTDVSAYGDPNDPIRQVNIAAAPNGVFSGRLFVGSDGPIKGLKVAAGDLAQVGGARIPATAVLVRYAEPVTEKINMWVPEGRFNALLDTIPPEIPAAGAPDAAGAVASLWLTVRVPRDAKPGQYEGKVTVSAEGLPPTTVPLKLDVCGWPVPDPKNYRMTNFGQISPDSLAKHYGVPLWSDRHWELIGRSMALMAEVNSRQVLVDMVVNFYGGNKGSMDCGNEESMVRWIRQPGGTPSTGSGPAGFKHDFTVFDKYLDLVDKTIGKPLPLRLNCWVEWRGKDPKAAVTDWCQPSKVTVLDPATGKLSQMDQPKPTSPEFVAFWKPVLEEARKKIEARGWFDVATIGHNSYCFDPHPLVVDAFNKIWPDGKWSYTAHNGKIGQNGCFFKGTDKAVSMPVFNADCVWTAPEPSPRRYARLLTPQKGYWCFTYRGTRNTCELVEVRNIPEMEMLRGLDGWSDFGVDFFPVKDYRGRKTYIGNGRGTGGPGDGTIALLAPGVKGPIATERYEMLREGLQVTEAILFLHRAADGDKISGDLKARVNRFLDERAEYMVNRWLRGCSRTESDEKLFTLAGEAAAAERNGK